MTDRAIFPQSSSTLPAPSASLVEVEKGIEPRSKADKDQSSSKPGLVKTVRRKKSAAVSQSNGSFLSPPSTPRRKTSAGAAPVSRKRSTLEAPVIRVKKISLQTDTVTRWGVVLKPVPMEQRMQRRSRVETDLGPGQGIELPELEAQPVTMEEYKREEAQPMKIDVRRKKRSRICQEDDKASSHHRDDDDDCDSKESSSSDPHPKAINSKVSFSSSEEGGGVTPLSGARKVSLLSDTSSAVTCAEGKVTKKLSTYQKVCLLLPLFTLRNLNVFLVVILSMCKNGLTSVRFLLLARCY